MISHYSVFCLGGNLFIVDATNLDILQSYCILASTVGSLVDVAEDSAFSTLFGAPPGVRPSAGGGAAGAASNKGVNPARARPASAGRMRPSSATTTSGQAKARPGSSAASSRAGDIVVAAGAGSRSLGKISTLQGAKRQVSTVPKDAWIRPGQAEEKELANAMEGVRGSANVIGLALVYRNSSVESVVVATGFGKVIHIDLSRSELLSGVPSSGKAASSSGRGSGGAHMDVVFHYHYGPLWSVSVLDKPFQDINLYVTGGDDRWLCIWNGHKRPGDDRSNNPNQRIANKLVTRIKTQGPIRATDTTSIYQLLTGTSKLGNLLELSIAVGFAKGRIAIYLATVKRKVSKVGATLVRETGENMEYDIRMILTRKDCVEDISDMKFSPNGKMLAVGSHDNYIDM